MSLLVRNHPWEIRLQSVTELLVQVWSQPPVKSFCLYFYLVRSSEKERNLRSLPSITCPLACLDHSGSAAMRRTKSAMRSTVTKYVWLGPDTLPPALPRAHTSSPKADHRQREHSPAILITKKGIRYIWASRTTFRADFQAPLWYAKRYIQKHPRMTPDKETRSFGADRPSFGADLAEYSRLCTQAWKSGNGGQGPQRCDAERLTIHPNHLWNNCYLL